MSQDIWHPRISCTTNILGNLASPWDNWHPHAKYHARIFWHPHSLLQILLSAAITLNHVVNHNYNNIVELALALTTKARRYVFLKPYFDFLCMCIYSRCASERTSVMRSSMRQRNLPPEALTTMENVEGIDLEILPQML